MLQARFLLSKGFGWQDDLEFCPVVLDSQPQLLQQLQNDSSNTNTNQNTHTPLNSSSSTFSSPSYTISPPTQQQQQVNISPSQSKSNSTPLTHTPRAKKVLDIVNPHTGLRVGSPSTRVL